MLNGGQPFWFGLDSFVIFHKTVTLELRMFVMKRSILISVFLLALSLSSKGAGSSGETRYSCEPFEQFISPEGSRNRRTLFTESIIVGGKEFGSSRADERNLDGPTNPITNVISIKDVKTVLLINDSSSTFKVLQSGKADKQDGEKSIARKGSCPTGEGRTEDHIVEEQDEPTLKEIQIARMCKKDGKRTQSYFRVKAEIIPDSTPIAFTTKTRERGEGSRTTRSSGWIETPSHIRKWYPEYLVNFWKPDNVLVFGYRSKRGETLSTRLGTRYGCALETL